MKGWRFFLREVPWRGDRDLFVMHESWDGKRAMLTSAVMQSLERGNGIREEDKPFLGQTVEEQQDGVGDVDNFLQAAMDAAWDAGMRPRNFKDRTDELSSVRYHLEDMRKMALKS